MSMQLSRRFYSEIGSLIGREVEVRLAGGRTYLGKLVAVNPDNLTMVIEGVVDEKGNKYSIIMVSGRIITEVILREKVFDLRGLAERLEKYFPRMVKYNEEAGIILVAERVKVNETGVIEGSGPIAERVREIYDEYVAEKGIE